MTEYQWDPGEILEISGAYWKTCVLHAAVKLDIFTAIGDKQLDAQSVAGELKADINGTERLLNALAAMKLLNKADGNFSNTESGATFLSKKSREYIGYMIMHHHFLMESWSRLDEAVRMGKQVRPRKSFDDPVQREAFLMGMFNNAMLIAPRLVKEVDISDKKHLLDLGGGPGAYAVHFCMENPNIKATVFDLSPTRPFAEKIIRQFKMDKRIYFQEGNYVEQDIAGEYDVVWMSHILHGEGPEVCMEMILKAVSCLETGGMIIIHDFFLDDSMSTPLFPALFSLNMLLGTSSGQSYTQSQVTDMLQKAGLKNIHRLSFRGPTESGIITAEL